MREALKRLRSRGLGLRGRIVGVVVITTLTTLGVAAVVLLPRLEHVLRDAAKSTLQREVQASSGEIDRLASVDYPYVTTTTPPPSDKSTLARKQRQAADALTNVVDTVTQQLGANLVVLVGYIDQQGYGCPIRLGTAVTQCSDAGLGSLSDVRRAFLHHRTVYSFGQGAGGQDVRAAVYLKSSHTVVAVRRSIDEIPDAVAAVRRAFEIAAGLGLLLTLLLAIPLAATVVRRLRRLREAALRLAIAGTGIEFPLDRARDEIGDLARSFSIMQRRLHRQEEARRAFVATASHELRTPLASLDGMLELMADDLEADQLDLEDAARMLERARAQSRRLGRLAADLLDLSRLDAEVTLRSEPIELGELGRAVLAEFELRAHDRGATPALQEPDAAVWALADPGSVARILRILLDNALRVAPAGTEVTVRVSDEPRPSLSVVDRGPGVPLQERALIFERFQRGSETGGEAGFGLGLAIGRELAERMGGSLVLADSDGSQGATFTLTLRPAPAPATEPIASTAGV